MSKAAPVIIIMLLLVGGIVLWGALTDWTFSGLLPREGAKCTPGDDEKAENAKQYVYDEDNECTVIQSCETNWKPNDSNTACISASTGEICTVSNPVPEGVYTYNTRGVCTMGSCITGYQKSGTGCISTLTGDPCDGSDQNAVYKYDTDGECVFDSCKQGYEDSDTGCVEIETCDPTTTEYDETQDGMCLNAENEIVNCPDEGLSVFKDITFKSGCGTKNIVHPDIDLGLVGCNSPENIQAFCNATPGCIGYRTFGNDCSRLILNTPPVCERYSMQTYVDQNGKDLDESGNLIGGLDTYYLNASCFNDPDATYETYDNYIGGPCPGEVDAHQAACSDNSECVGFKFNTDGNRSNKCSHFLRKKTT